MGEEAKHGVERESMVLVYRREKCNERFVKEIFVNECVCVSVSVSVSVSVNRARYEPASGPAARGSSRLAIAEW